MDPKEDEEERRRSRNRLSARRNRQRRKEMIQALEGQYSNLKLLNMSLRREYEELSELLRRARALVWQHTQVQYPKDPVATQTLPLNSLIQLQIQQQAALRNDNTILQSPWSSFPVSPQAAFSQLVRPSSPDLDNTEANAKHASRAS